MGGPSSRQGVAMPQIFASPLMRRYYAPFASQAYLFRFIVACASVVIPFVISYTIAPFWLKEHYYTEQPTVHFKHQMIIMLEGNKPGSELLWSTYDQLNAMVGTKYRVAEIQAREEDKDLDGMVDDIYINARFPLKSGESVHHVRVMSFFDYKLQNKVPLQMESAVYFDHASPVSGGELKIWGDMTLRQRSILPQSNSWRSVYNTSIIEKSNGGIDSIQQVLFSTLIANYVARNETTAFTDPYPVWVAGSSQEFNLDAHIHVRPATVQYQPGVMETLRYGMLQFLAVYVVAAAVIGTVTHFIFENQVFETRVQDDSRPKTHIH